MTPKQEFRRAYGYARLQARYIGCHDRAHLSPMERAAITCLKTRNHTRDTYKNGLVFYRSHNGTIVQIGGMRETTWDIPF